MKRPLSLLPLSILSLLLPCPSLANDGRNRYEGAVPTQLFHLDGPVSPEAGFRVLPADTPAGADGDPAYRWVERHALAILRLSCCATARALGPGPYPLSVFDLAAENGDTPVDFGVRGAQGRHPGGSHDGGLNLDLGYYLTSEKGQVEAQDPAACTAHYAAAPGQPPGQPPKDENKCVGPPDRLDTDRQTLFLIEVVRLHRDRFGGDLLEAIGIDAKVRRAVLPRAADRHHLRLHIVHVPPAGARRWW